MTKCKNRFKVVKSHIVDNENPRRLITMNDCCDLLNQLDKDNKLLIATLRQYDGKWLFDGSILSFAEVLNKVTQYE